MQFLASLHVVLTCSFVFLLAYLLSRVFTYLAHSLIHGSPPSRRTESFSPQFQKPPMDADADDDDDHVAAMDRFHEANEDAGGDDTQDAFLDAQVHTVVAHRSKYDMGGGIFDEEVDIEYDVQRDDGKGGLWNKTEGLDYGAAAEMENKDNERGAAQEKEENGSKSGLEDAQGSGSLKQRLPPTWSELQRMVNLSSKEHSSPPSVSPVPEY